MEVRRREPPVLRVRVAVLARSQVALHDLREAGIVQEPVVEPVQ
jgi:hypothetical protein